MKKLNKKGFTLIELLAVITIMGILMIVAIPAVQRTIENSRRDTFLDTAKTYLNAVRNAVIADELKCGTVSISAATGTTFTVTFNSANTTGTDLVNQGGKSAWSNKDVNGIIKITKSGSGASMKYTYAISIVDGTHGIKEMVDEAALARGKVLTSGATAPTAVTGTSTACTVDNA